MPRIAIIGCGAIAAEMLACLDARGLSGAVACVLARSHRVESLGGKLGTTPLVDGIGALLACHPDIVVECAGHEAVRTYGGLVLESGIDLIIASVGALADDMLAAALARASASGGRVLIPSGAVAGIDGLLAARTAGLAKVSYTSVKPPRAWKGTPAETLLALDDLTGPRGFFEGSAREAGLQYPKNANVGATIALATLGFDQTRVRLVADPAATGPRGLIEAEGAFGAFRFETFARASPLNPKTSLLTAHSLLLAAERGWAFEPTLSCS